MHFVGVRIHIYFYIMGKRKVHDELPFSSDDEINSDDFDSDSDIEPRRFDKINQKVPAKSRNKYVTGLYSALGITDEEVQKLKNNESSSKSNPAVPVSKSGRPLPEVIVFDDPSKRQKVHVVKLLLLANVHAFYIFN
jgi:hypothetical protein